MIVKALQRRHRLSFESKFTVIIIFDYEGACTFGPFENGHPPLQRHRHSQRKLVGRSQINSPGVRTDFLSRGNRQAFLVHRHRDDLGSNIAKSNTGAKVSRVLRPNLVMFLKKQARQQIERLLSSGDDDDLFRVASHTSGCSQIVCNSIAQWPIPTPIGLCL